jgi:Na+:H+ antiporter, NhaC family
MTEADEPPRKIKEPSYADGIAPMLLLVVLIAGAVALFGLQATEGPIQVALILAAMFTALIILKNGHPWEEIAEAGRKGVSSVVSAIFILLSVGALIGAWNMSGTIPTLVFYGIQILSPNWFYLASLVICSAISMGIGSSWTTAGTIGVGLTALATLAGVSPVITAGAVVSGAYVGDKLSPLSETTVLAAQLTGNDVYTHLRAQMKTSVPAFILAAVLFGMIGLMDGSEGAGEAVIASELVALDGLFHITPLNLLPLVLLVTLSVLRVPASLAIMAAALFAGLMAPLLQSEAVLRFVGTDQTAAPWDYIKGIWQALATGYRTTSGIAEVDSLLSRGGMDSMLKTIWLILGALVFGTLLDEFGLLSKLITPMLKAARTSGQLVASAAGTAIGLNIIAGDQYLALVLPARLFRREFEARGLPSTNLSRTLADAGTVTSPLVPWNSCGAYMSAVLGVPTLLYLPFCFFNLASPLLTVVVGARMPTSAARLDHNQVPRRPYT